MDYLGFRVLRLYIELLTADSRNGTKSCQPCRCGRRYQSMRKPCPSAFFGTSPGLSYTLHTAAHSCNCAGLAARVNTGTKAFLWIVFRAIQNLHLGHVLLFRITSLWEQRRCKPRATWKCQVVKGLGL